jgi:hypothetical protein
LRAEIGGEGVSDKVENQTENQNKEMEKAKSKFNWVTERSSCSLPKAFKELRLEVEEDVKTRNAQRPNNSPYEFSVVENGEDFSVILKTKDAQKSVVFRLAEHAILVRDDKGDQMFQVTLTFNEEGKCKLHVNKEERELWQVRRMALEDLMFRGY